MTENELRERVDELEQQLAALAKEKRSKMSRRDLLAAGGMLAGGSILGGAATNELSQPASAASPTGQVDANVVDTNSLNTEQLTSNSATLNQLSGYHILSPNVSDWGAAVNSKISEMVEGDILIIPPGAHNTSTTGVVDKKITITSWGGSNDRAENPAIVKQADVPVLEIQTNATISGLTFESDVADTTPGMVVHRTVHADGIVGDGIGSHVVHMLQDGSTGAQNLNHSRVQATGLYCDGDVIKTEKTSANPLNINACRFEVPFAFEITGYAVNITSGFGNVARVQLCEANAPTGAIRFGSDRNFGRVDHAEGDQDAIVFDAELCRGELSYGSNLANRRVLNNPNNEFVELIETQKTDIYKGFRNHMFGGTDVEAMEPGRGFVVQTPDGSGRYRIAVDNSGNLTTTQL